MENHIKKQYEPREEIEKLEMKAKKEKNIAEKMLFQRNIQRHSGKLNV